MGLVIKVHNRIPLVRSEDNTSHPTVVPLDIQLELALFVVVVANPQGVSSHDITRSLERFVSAAQRFFMEGDSGS